MSVIGDVNVRLSSSIAQHSFYVRALAAKVVFPVPFSRGDCMCDDDRRRVKCSRVRSIFG